MKKQEENTIIFIKADEEKNISKNKLLITWFLLSAIYISGIQWLLCSLAMVGRGNGLKIQGLMIAVCFVAFIFLQIYKDKEKYLPFFYLAAAFFVFIISGAQKMRISFFNMLNYVIGWWNTAHDDGVLLFSVQKADTDGIIKLIIMVSFIIYIMFFAGLKNLLDITEKKIFLEKDIDRKHNRSLLIVLSTVLTAFACILSLLIEHISWFGLTLLLVGQMGIYMYRFSDRIYFRMCAWYMVGLVIMCVAALLYDGQSSKFTKTIRENTKQETEDLRYGKNILPEGDLYKSHKLTTSDKKVLQVDTEIVKDIYLYGYVGADYENGRWQPLKKSAYGNKNTGMSDWLKQNNFPVNNILGMYNSLENKNKTGNTIKIKNIGTDREKLYTTLSTVKISGSKYKSKNDNGYSASGLRGAYQYKIEEVTDELPGEMISVKKWVQQPTDTKQKQYVNAENVYRKFVYENYLGVSDELSDYIRKNFVKGAKKSDKTGIYSLTRYIREVLKDKTLYNKRPEAFSENEEPIVEFITKNKAGNSVMYASTAVEVFRAFGIPARYAEGFLLRKADIQKEESGKVTLMGKNAHAWVQVYMDAAGWVDIDVTPGFYYEEHELMHMVESPKGMKLTAELKNSTGNRGKKESGMKKNDSSRNTITPALILKTFAIFIAIIIAAAVLYLMVSEIRKIVTLNSYNARLDKSGEDEKGRIMYERITDLLKIANISVHLGWQTKETELNIKNMCPSVDDGEYQNINHILEKNIYGNEKLKQWEINEVKEFIDKIYYDLMPLKRAGGNKIFGFTRK